jgi:hypothetical protein
MGNLDTSITEQKIQNMVPEGVKNAILSRTSGGRYIAFLSITDHTFHKDSLPVEPSIFIPVSSISDDLYNKLIDLISNLQVALETQMMPQEIILINATSESESGREALIHRFEELADDELTTFSLFANLGKSRGDEGIWTDTETKLRALWAKALKIEDVKQIGRQDNFFKIGGDSITTIHLVSLAQVEGIKLIASEVFANLELSAMAMCIDKKNDGVTSESSLYEPFQLLRAVEDVDSALKHIAQACSSDIDSISDAYPCTPLQEGLMSLTFKQPGSYVARHVFKLPNTIDVARLKDSWQVAARLCDVLRTRMVQLPGGSIVQVVMDEEIDWEEDSCSDIETFIKSNRKAFMELDCLSSP